MDKHILNDPRLLALEACLGLAQTHPGLEVDEEHRIVARQHDQVGLVSGGGSGHEPSFGGMVGTGLLTTAVAGNIFASPNVNQIRRGIQLASRGKGVLIIIMRYTGDVLHFGLAKEQTSVSHPSLVTRLLLVGDDVAVTRSQGSITGRRGLAGTTLVLKVAGASIAKGEDLNRAFQVASLVAERTGTIGSGLGHCSLPGSQRFEQKCHLGNNEIEIGMGIHNEPGVKTMELPKTPELIRIMLDYITNTSDPERSFVPFKNDGSDTVVLMINNLGGMSELELSAIAGETLIALEERSIRVARVGVGRYMTSINLPGFSITLLLLPVDSSVVSSSEVLDLLDEPTDAAGWVSLHVPQTRVSLVIAGGQTETQKGPESTRSVLAFDYGSFERALKSACQGVIRAEPEITRFDTIAGDGDCGTCLEAGAKELMKALSEGRVSKVDLILAIGTLAEGIEQAMDGTSGALYSIWMNALAGGFHNVKSVDAEAWATALTHALSSLCEYTNARPPSRTLMDPLFAFTESFKADQQLSKAVQAAHEATEITRHIHAKAGRAAYVEQKQLKDANVPDPGAYGVVEILKGIQKSFNL